MREKDCNATGQICCDNVVNGSDLTSLSDINDRHRLCKTVCMPYDFESKLCTTEDALGKLMASRNSAIYCSDAK
jgi:hypothetical protein